MPRFKKAIELNNIDDKLRKKLDSSPSYIKQAIGKGSAGKRVTEAFPDFYAASAERVLENGTNAYLVERSSLIYIVRVRRQRRFRRRNT